MNYCVRLFICGDYQLLSKVYGLLGPSGMSVTKYAHQSYVFYDILGQHPCLWCLISLNGRQISKSIRALQSFHDYHKSFMDSCGDAKLVK